MAKTKITPRKEPEFKCGFCPETFKLKEDRDNHMISCFDNRIKCEQCNYHCTRLSNLHRHIRARHSHEESKNDENNNDKDDVAEKSSDESDWEKQDPGCVIEDTEDDCSKTKDDDDKDMPSTTMNEPVVSKDMPSTSKDMPSASRIKFRLEYDPVVEASVIRKKTKPNPVGLKRKRTEQDSRQEEPEEKRERQVKDSNVQEEERKVEEDMKVDTDSVERAEHVSDGGVRSMTETRESGTQTSPIYFTTKIQTTTEYMENGRKVTVVETKEVM